MPKIPLSLATDISPYDFAKLMFKNTSPDGELYLCDWYDTLKDDLTTTNSYFLRINWDEKDVEEIIKHYIQLQRDLREISVHLNELDAVHLAETNPFINTSNGILKSQWLEATYFIFVAPFKVAPDEMLSEVIGRVGDDLFGYQMICHARRLCKLMSLKAPMPVIYNEGRMLIAAMVVYHCGVEAQALS